MPEPVPTPSAAQIVSVAAITGLSTDTVSVMIASPIDQDIANATWTLALKYANLWDAAAEDAGDVKKVGEIEFFENKSGDFQLDLKTKILNLYGKGEIYSPPISGCYSSGGGVRVISDW